MLTIRVHGRAGLRRVRATLVAFGVGSGRVRTEAESEGEVRIVSIDGDLAANTVSRLLATLRNDPDVIGLEGRAR